MDCNYICGEILSWATAQHYHELTLSLYNLITYTLDRDSKYSLASQKQDTWSLRSARHPDPVDESISDIKSRIHSRHVGFYEDWKEIKYEAAFKWPVSLHAGSLWKTFARAMDQDQPIYKMRNWFSHDFGKRGGTLEVENEKFKELQEAYGSLLPALTELQIKLELALRDEAAWAPRPETRARKYEENQPEYTRDTMAVQLALAAREEEFNAKMKQADIDYAASLARVERGEDAWECEEWVMTEDIGEEWVSIPGEGAVSWSDLDEAAQVLRNYPSKTDDEISECTEDFPATSAQDPDDGACDSGYEDDNDILSSLCIAPALDAGYINATILHHGDEVAL